MESIVIAGIILFFAGLMTVGIGIGTNKWGSVYLGVIMAFLSGILIAGVEFLKGFAFAMLFGFGVVGVGILIGKKMQRKYEQHE